MHNDAGDDVTTLNSYGSDDEAAGFKFYSMRSGHTRMYALKIMYLARLLTACHAADPTGASCQFSAAATAELRMIIVERELDSFNPDAQYQTSDGTFWGWEQASDGCCGYDLHSTAAFKHFCHFVDNFRDEIQATNPTKYQQLLDKLSFYVTDFESDFDQGYWTLWNGNNWTPFLSEGVMHWVITFWHDDTERASRIMKIINDINMIHIPMTTINGGYKEGVCQYSYVSAPRRPLREEMFHEGQPTGCGSFFILMCSQYSTILMVVLWHSEGTCQSMRSLTLPSFTPKGLERCGPRWIWTG